MDTDVFVVVQSSVPGNCTVWVNMLT